MINKKLPGTPSFEKGGQAGADQLGSRSDSPNIPSPNGSQAPPALQSEALCAAGYCVAAVLAGFKPTGIEMRPRQSGRWLHEVGGINVAPASAIGIEIFMAGTAARYLVDSDEPDVIALLEHMAAGIMLGIETPADAMQRMKLVAAARALILQHELIIREIADRLVRAKSMSGAELNARVESILRGQL
jgi:hypothetical protein